MSRSATLSILGLYNWDNTLFDYFSVPEALDKDMLISNLLAELAELEVIYTNPVVMKNLIGVWSAKQIDIWNRLYATTQYEYNPIENYDRNETGTDAGTDSTTHTGSDRSTESVRDGGSEGFNSTIEKTGEDTITGTDTKGHWKAGFDSAASGDDDGLVKETRDQDDGSTTTEYGNTVKGTSRTTFGKTQSRTGDKTYGSEINSVKNGSHTLRAHGNIGVTTTQEMIRQQREIEQFNLYDIIINEFRNRFCILVY